MKDESLAKFLLGTQRITADPSSTQTMGVCNILDVLTLSKLLLLHYKHTISGYCDLLHALANRPVVSQLSCETLASGLCKFVMNEARVVESKYEFN